MKNKVVIVTGASSTATFTKIYFNVSEEYAIEQFKKQTGSQQPSSQLIEFDESLNLVSFTNEPVSVTANPTLAVD